MQTNPTRFRPAHRRGGAQAAPRIASPAIAGFLSLALVAAAPTSAASDDSALWSHAIDVILDTSPSGADVASAVSAFPLLVRLTSPTFDFAASHGRGRDLRFLDSAGATLPHHIDSWDSAGGRAAVWVRLPRVKGHAQQTLRLLYGRPDAADLGNAGTVFPAEDGYLGVWHLGGPKGARANAVPGGNAAQPGGYEGDEDRAGIIGRCDSLDGAARNADHLDIGDGYDDFTEGFTFSVWAHPTAAGFYARLLDLGNGQNRENIVVSRVGTGDNASFKTTQTPGWGVSAPSLLGLNQWHHITATYSEGRVRLYRNGEQVAAVDGQAAPAKARRISNFLGRSNWAADAGFQGKLDEAVLARTGRSAAYIRLAYRTQRQAQTAVRLRKATNCAFFAPRDTSVREGETLVLRADPGCADAFGWSAIAGPAPRIHDPAAPYLSVAAPRIAGDTLLGYRFEAATGTAVRADTVWVRVREAIPEPRFSLPPGLAWDGARPLEIRPDIANLDEVRACRDSVLRWAWTLDTASGTADALVAAPDTAWRAGALEIRSTGGRSEIPVRLCLDNGGPVICGATRITLVGPVTLGGRAVPARIAPAAARAYDAAGRDRGMRPEGGGRNAPLYAKPRR